MKKFKIFITILALFVSSIAFAQGGAVAIIKKTRGKVQIKSNPGKWADAQRGKSLKSGDALRTGKDGFAAIAFLDDASTLKVTSNTSISIEGKVEQKKINKRIQMEIGDLLAKVTKQKGTFEIATPTSVASVKGTEFWTLVDEQGNTVVIGIDGLVALLNKISNKAADIGKGNTGASGKDGNVNVTPTDPKNIPHDPEAGEVGNQIEVQFKDDTGATKTLKIKYE